MKAYLIGVVKAIVFIVFTVLTLCLIEGTTNLNRVDVTGVLAVSAILRHFIDREQDKQ